jgi:hypothetical protein
MKQSFRFTLYDIAVSIETLVLPSFNTYTLISLLYKAPSITVITPALAFAKKMAVFIALIQGTDT